MTTQILEDRAFEARTSMTVKECMPDPETHAPLLYDLAAVGLVLPGGQTILHPSGAGHTDEMYENKAPEEPKLEFSLASDGVLTKMDQFANRYGILGVPDDETIDGKNAIAGYAINAMLRSGYDFSTAFRNIVPQLKGAFSLIAKHEDKLFLGIDRHGLGNMFVGKLPSGGYVASSQQKSVEEYADATFKLKPHEIAQIDAEAVYTTQWMFK